MSNMDIESLWSVSECTMSQPADSFLWVSDSKPSLSVTMECENLLFFLRFTENGWTIYAERNWLCMCFWSECCNTSCLRASQWWCVYMFILSPPPWHTILCTILYILYKTECNCAKKTLHLPPCTSMLMNL